MKFLWSVEQGELLLERGAQGFVGAGSVNLDTGWSVERWLRLERGALM